MTIRDTLIAAARAAEKRAKVAGYFPVTPAAVAGLIVLATPTLDEALKFLGGVVELLMQAKDERRRVLP